MKKVILSLSIFVNFVSGQEKKGETFIKYDTLFLSKYEHKSTNYSKTLDKDTFKERFEFLDANTKLNIDYNDVTYQYVQKYLGYGWFGKTIGLSVYYFPLFEAKLAQYGVPKELKYLAVVESNLNPRAGSWVGAQGLWQFMPATGAQYGLKKNEDVNVFYDPVASSDAAARYLKDLYNEFHNWNLAISAYNCGAGNVRKAMRRAGSSNYWQVRPYMPSETQAYVPSFIAVNYMFNMYKKHNIKPMYFKYSFRDVGIVVNPTELNYNELEKLDDLDFIRFANPQFMTAHIPKGSVIYKRKGR